MRLGLMCRDQSSHGSDEAEKARLEFQLVALDENRTVIAMHPAAIEAHQKRAQALADALAQDASGEAAQIVRSLIERIEIIPDSSERGVENPRSRAACRNSAVRRAGTASELWHVHDGCGGSQPS